MSQNNPCRSIHSQVPSKYKTFFERETVAVDSIIKEDPLFLVLFEIFCQVRKERGNQDVIAFHQDRLGVETHVFRPEKKLYAWDKNNYRVIVSNTTGIHLEVELGASFETAQAGIESYLADMRLPIDVATFRGAIGGNNSEEPQPTLTAV